MSKIVIDTNLINFELIDLESFFARNTIYISDNLIFETIKSGKVDSIVMDFKKFIPYKRKIYFLDGIGEIINKELEDQNPITNIEKFAHGSNDYPLNDLFDIAVSGRKNTDSLVKNYKDIISGTEGYKKNMAEGLIKFYSELESSNLLTTFVKDEFGESFIKALKEFILKHIQEVLYDKIFSEARNSNIENLLSSYPFLCRTILASVAICLYYKKNGGVLPQIKKFTNTMTDSSFFVYASYVDYLLTDDKTAKEIFNNYFMPLINALYRIGITSQAYNKEELMLMSS